MKAHFIGICGAGMSAVAKLLQDSGWEVSGSDEGFYPPISLYLSEHNLACTTPYAAKNIPPDVDVIIIGKHAKLVPESNPEVAAAFKTGKPIKSFPDIVHELTGNSNNFVVAGSFGKSTCVSLAAFTLTHAGKDPSYFIGAVPLDLPDNAHLGKGDIFVIEGDEYPSSNWDNSSKFLHYNPSTVLLISAEHDHVNVFPTVEDFVEPFYELLAMIPDDKIITACVDGENVNLILEKLGRPVVTYSLKNPQAEWRAGSIVRGDVTSFDLVFRNQRLTTITTSLLGDHNVQNMVGVAAWLLSNDVVTLDELVAAFKAFKGVKRRLEKQTTNTSVIVYEDFGSSRAKALAGMSTLKQQFPSRRRIAIFEPHTFSFRNRASLEWYKDLFNDVDLVYIYALPSHGSATHDQLTQAEIVAKVKSTGKNVTAVTSKDQILTEVKKMAKPGDVIVMITSGDLGGAIELVTDYIQTNFSIVTEN